MKVHWTNILAVLLGGGALLFLFTSGSQISAFIANIKKIGPGHSSEEQTMGLIALGFLCAAFIAVFRLLLNRNKP